jgi:putative inorganic carbon (HCO3(-)) transporter
MKNVIQRGAEWLTRIEIWPVAFLIAISMAWPRFLPYAVGFGLLFWLVRLVAYGHLSVRSPVDLSALLLALMAPLSLYVSILPEVTGVQLLRLISGLVLFYAVINWTQDRRKLMVLISGTAGVGFLLALTAPISVQWTVAKLPVLPSGLYDRFVLLFSDWVHPNVLAGTLVILLPIPYCMLLFNWREISWLERIVHFLATITMTLIIVLTQSRGAWIALGAVLVISLGLRWRWGWIGLVISGVIAAGAIYQFGINTITQALASNPSLGDINGRVEIWSRALLMIQDFPLSGIGTGLFTRIADLLYPFYTVVKSDLNHAHNLFLQIGVDMGIPGLVAWLSILVLILVLSWQLYRKGRIVSSWAAGVGAGLLLSQFALILHGLTDSVTWGMVRSAPIVWGIWGIAAASSSIAAKRMNNQNSQIMEHA